MSEYVELHAHSYYSLLDGVPSPEGLVQRAVEHDMSALALTDHDALYGAARFAVAAEQAGIKPIFGVELTLVNGGGHLTLLAENDTGYTNICRLITRARQGQTKGLAALPWRLLAEHAEGIIALSGCRRSEIARMLLEPDYDRAQQVAERFAAIFGRDHFYLELQRHHERGDRRLNSGLTALAKRLNLPLVATGNMHYLDREDAPLHDVLTCIRHSVTLDRANGLLRSNAEYTFRSPQEMTQLFADWPDALRNTLVIAERCNAQLPIGPQVLPQIPLPVGLNAAAYLKRLCNNALIHKCASSKISLKEYRNTLERELAIIAEQHLANYFLVVWDVMRFARERGILCQGRGSAANSFVAYLLDITPIDPLAYGLVFERFISRERVSMPDIDIDFHADRREEVIQYLYQTYGHDHAAMACTVVTFGAKQAIRDVGKVLGFAPETIEHISHSVDAHSASDLVSASTLRNAFGDQLDTPRWQQLLAIAAALDGFPRHLSIHSGGMILSGPPLIDKLPVEPATKEERYVVQWDKDSLELAGWIKLDVLSLRMLSAISDACQFIEEQTGHRCDLAQLRLDDPKVYELICSGETVGVFQVESRAQASLIPRFQPRRFADLVVQIALIRPGPVQGNMVHPYLNRRDGIEPVRYLHPLLEDALSETLGVILFQEQVLKVARDLAGFTPGEGELLRRALSHKRADEQIESFRQKFLDSAQAKGVSRKIALQVFEQLKAFGGYSFSKAHAAAFAVITYWSAWLRCYYPLAFFAGILRHDPMGFYPKHVVVEAAKRAGVKFLPVDLRLSQANVTVEGDAIRLGLSYVSGYGPQQIEIVEDERRRRPFESLADLVQRTKLDRRHVEALVLSGALDYIGERRQLLWDIAEAYHLAKRPKGLPLKGPDETVKLSPMEKHMRIATSFATTGVSLDAHLTELRRDVFTRAGAGSIGELKHMRDGQRVKIGGLVVAVQRPPTANGFCFLAVEDSDAMVNVVVAPKVYEACREAIRSTFVLIEGAVQFDHGAINVVAREVKAV